MMVMIGDTIHNFVDGVLLAAAFLADWNLGLVTALAIMAHEVPSQVGNFVVLLHSGYTRRQALTVNLLCSTAMVLGGLAGYLALNRVQAWVPLLLGFVAASMIYVAVADLIPHVSSLDSLFAPSPHNRHHLILVTKKYSHFMLSCL